MSTNKQKVGTIQPVIRKNKLTIEQQPTIKNEQMATTTITTSYVQQQAIDDDDNMNKM